MKSMRILDKSAANATNETTRMRREDQEAVSYLHPLLFVFLRLCQEYKFFVLPVLHFPFLCRDTFFSAHSSEDRLFGSQRVAGGRHVLHSMQQKRTHVISFATLYFFSFPIPSSAFF